VKVAQSDTALIADIAPSAQSLEGYLFPDTYQFSRMDDMQDMGCGHGQAVSSGRLSDRIDSNGGRYGCSVELALDSHQIVAGHECRIHRGHGLDRRKKKLRSPRNARWCGERLLNRLQKRIALMPTPASFMRNCSRELHRALHHDDMQFNSPPVIHTYNICG